MVKFCYEYFLSAFSDVESCWRSVMGMLVPILLWKVETKYLREETGGLGSL